MVETQLSSDVSIIGAGFQLPGASSWSSLEEVLFGARSLIRRYGTDELRSAGVRADEYEEDGYIPAGAPLESADEFDNEIFGLTMLESSTMDPQFRKVLEASFAALVDARLFGGRSTSNVAVFASCGMAIYAGTNIDTYLSRCVDLLRKDGLTLGSLQTQFLNSPDWLAATVSHKLGLCGPSMNVQTACSSALVGLHLAVESLRRRECDVAIVAAAAIHVPLKKGYVYQEGGIYSRLGACVPFGANADGTVGGCGAGAVVLRRSDEARAIGDRVYGVIKSSAVNNDGRRKPSFAAPSVEGQLDALAAAIRQSGVDPADIGMVEAHGTGTRLGDPIELSALSKALPGQSHNPVYLGSIKGNIGHLDTAAGMAGLLKVLVALRSGRIPPTLGASPPNPLLNLSRTRFVLPKEAVGWDRPAGGLRTALINSLGAGGTNCAIIVQEAGVAREAPVRLGAPAETKLVISAPSQAALRLQVENIRQTLLRHRGSEAAVCREITLFWPRFAWSIDFCGAPADIVNLLKASLSQPEIGSREHQPLSPSETIPDTPDWTVDDLHYELQRTRFWPNPTPPVVCGHALQTFDIRWVQDESRIRPVHWTGPATISVCVTRDDRRTDFGENAADLSLLAMATNPSEPGTKVLVFPQTTELFAAVEFLTNHLKELDRQSGPKERLMVVTTDAVPRDPARCGSELYALWGMVRSIRDELDGVQILLRDTDCLTSDSLSAMLLSGLDAPEALFHGGEIRLPYLERRKEPSGYRKVGSGDPTVIITGATGGIASILIKELKRRGARNLVLIGRTANALSGSDLLLGSDIHVRFIEADLGSGEVPPVLREICSSDDPKEIYHLAGRNEDATLTRLALSQFRTMYLAKCQTIKTLMEAVTNPATVSGLVLFSSASALFGNAGQAYYSAANAVLDHLAASLRSRGINATSVSWPAWAGVGMAAKSAPRGEIGKLTLDPKDAANVASAIMGSDAPMVFVCREGALPSADLLPLGSHCDGKQSRGPLAITDISADTIADVIGGVLGRRLERYLWRESFLELGLDSLGLVHLRSALKRRLGSELSISDLYTHSSVNQLSDALRDRGRDSGTSAANKKPAAPTLAGNDPIAVIGIGLVAPGGIRDPASFWKALEEARVFTTTPLSSRLLAADLEATTFASLDDVDLFSFKEQDFSISPKAARSMDPQHRVLLTVAKRAVEDAGLDIASTRGTRTGVYIGMGSDDHASLLSSNGQAYTPEAVLGANRGVGIGRISLAFGWHGPAIAVDTTCSSSLVAVDLAVQALRAGACDSALAGGVHLVLSPSSPRMRAALGVISEGGQLRAFDERADGFVQGEGCGLILLKRLSDAVHDGDRIHGVISATSVRHNGSSNGIQAPNGEAQAEVIRQCWEGLEIPPTVVQYVEAHGTGTRLGDPIELAGIAETYGNSRKVDNPLYVGSLKANFGHLEPAAGIFSLIKGLLVAKYKAVVPQPNFDSPSSHIAWGEKPIEVPTGVRTLKGCADGGVWVGVSSFGINGTIAHVVVRDYVNEAGGLPNGVPTCIVISENTSDETTVAARSLAKGIQRRTVQLEDLSRAAKARPAAKYYIAASGTSDAELATELANARVSRRKETPRVAMIFGGQGTQVSGGARELYEHRPEFREVVDKCAVAFRRLGNHRDFRELMFSPDEHEISRTENAQPVIYAYSWGIYNAFAAAGVSPDVVLGHSVGEFAAAAAAGIISFEDGFELVVERGLLMSTLPTGTGMLHAKMPEQVLLDLLYAEGIDAEVSAINGRESVVLGGNIGALATISSKLEQLGRSSSMLPVSHAFHTSAVEPILSDWARHLKRYRLTSPRSSIISTVSGRFADVEFTDHEYWVGHLRKKVNFWGAVEQIQDRALDAVVLLSQRPVFVSELRSLSPLTTGVTQRSLAAVLARVVRLAQRPNSVCVIRQDCRLGAPAPDNAESGRSYRNAYDILLPSAVQVGTR